MIAWRVYYGDDSTLDNTQCDVFHLPTQNVQCVVQPDSEVGRIVLHRFDYYYWIGDSWKGSDVGGFWDYLFHHKGPKYTLFGRTILSSEYTSILQVAIADPDFTKFLRR